MRRDEPPIVVEQVFTAVPERIWNALTKLEEMHQWYFDNIPAFEARVGFETSFNIHNEGRDFSHQWIITEAFPPSRLAYDWTFAGYTGKSTALFELLPERDFTRLRLTVTVHEDFPDNVPEFRRESCVGGWEYFIQQRLKTYIEDA